MLRVVNKESGVLGISGISSDMRDIERALRKATSVPNWPWICMNIAS